MNGRHGSVFDSSMHHVAWRFWWADTCFNRPGLYFWAGQYRGNVRLWGLDFLLQLLIFAFTVPGLWLAGGNGPEAKWGFLVLLCSQPLWLIAAWRAGQFGIFTIAVIYTAIWARSVFNYF